MLRTNRAGKGMEGLHVALQAEKASFESRLEGNEGMDVCVLVV